LHGQRRTTNVFDLIIANMRLILASSSPRRAELLAAAGFGFDILAVEIDERTRDRETAADYVRRLASEKSQRGVEILRERAPDLKAGPAREAITGSARDVVVLAADTAVVVDGEILGKPRDDEDARRMLRMLSGRLHDVMTGVSLRSSHTELAGMETTSVWFSSLTPDDVAWYLETGEGRDKAGAYAIQGRASRFIPRISGSYSNVVGLPVALVTELLAQLEPRATSQSESR